MRSTTGVTCCRWSVTRSRAASAGRSPRFRAGPRCGQGVGLVFALAGVAGYAANLVWLGRAATALALVAAFLNGAFGFCLGCETYLIIRRIWPGRQALVPAS